MQVPKSVLTALRALKDQTWLALNGEMRLRDLKPNLSVILDFLATVEKEPEPKEAEEDEEEEEETDSDVEPGDTLKGA